MNDFTIFFKSRKYPVNRELFESYSKRFRQLAKKVTTIDMSTSVMEESFTDFVNACQMRDYTVCVNNLYDLKHLAKTWEVDVLLECCQNLKGNLSEADLALAKVLFLARSGKKHNKQITPVAKNFLYYVETNQIRLIPASVMTEIIRNSSFNIPQPFLFDILVSRFDRDPTFAKIFQYLNPDEFTVDNVLWLKDHSDKIDTGYIPVTKISATQSIREEVDAQQGFVHEYAESVKQKQKQFASIEESLVNTEQKLKDARNSPITQKEPDFTALLDQIAKEEDKLAKIQDTLNDQTDDVMDAEGQADDIESNLGRALALIEQQLSNFLSC